MKDTLYMTIGRSRQTRICLISLYASRAVKFAAVVDSKGKLILAKFKKFHIQSHRASLISAPKIQQQDHALVILLWTFSAYT
jgi:hypothetical protein